VSESAKESSAGGSPKAIAAEGLRLLRAERLAEGVARLEVAHASLAPDERAVRVQVLMNLAAARVRLGDLTRARADLDLALGLETTPEQVLFVLDLLAYLEVERGDVAPDLSSADAARAAVTEPVTRVASLAHAARLRARGCDAARALALADDALARAASLPDVLVDARLAVAEASLVAGRAEVAHDAARLAHGEATTPGQRAEALVVLARAALALSRPAEAAEHARAAEAQAGEAGLLRVEARLALSRALAAHAPAESTRLAADALAAARIGGLGRLAREAERALAAHGSAARVLAALSTPSGASTTGALARVLQAGDAGHMLDLAIGLLVEATGAERGVLVLLDAVGRPTTTVARNLRDDELSGPQFSYSRRLVEEAARTRTPVVVADARADPRFAGSESVTDLQLRSVLCVPAPGDPPRAVLYLDVRKEPGRFGQEAADLAARLVHELGPALTVAEDRARLERDVAGLRASSLGPAPRGAAHGLVGESDVMRRLLRDVERAARTDITCLITGESGTGKELVARAVHALGARAKGPFVVVACGAVPDELIESELFGHVKGAFTGATSNRVGLFEAASGGTLLLDDVAAMSPLLQAKLLRVLEDGRVRPVGSSTARTVDVRVLAAAQDELEPLVETGDFRRDLFYRLNGFTLRAPPLRERREDVPLLLDHFLARHADEASRPRPFVSQAAREALLAYAWPGNVRELENEVRRLVALGARRVLRRHLSPSLRGPGAETPPTPEGATLEEALAVVEKELIATALRESKGNISEASRRLGIERTKLLRRMRTYGLDKRGRPA
jgi:DNA-binding NtrC family response regulator